MVSVCDSDGIGIVSVSVESMLEIDVHKSRRVSSVVTVVLAGEQLGAVVVAIELLVGNACSNRLLDKLILRNTVVVSLVRLFASVVLSLVMDCRN